MSLTEKLTRLNLALRILGEASTEAQLLERILDVLDQVFDQPTAAVLLVEADGEHLGIVASRGYDSPEAARYRGRLGQGIVGRVAASGLARLVPDVRLEADYLPGMTDALTEMAVPLSAGPGVLGVLDLERRDTPFTDEDIALLTAFGEHAAWALRHLRALRAAEERARRMALLQQAALELNAAQDPEALLERILSLAEAALGFRSVALLEARRDGRELVVKKVLRREGIQDLCIPSDQGIVGSVFQSGRGERVRDTQADPRYIAGGLEGGASEMAVPLCIEGQVIGVLDAESEGVGAFDAADLELFSGFAAQVATALLNARRLEKIAHQAAVVRNITLTSHALNTTREVELLIQEILMAAEDALGLERVALLMPDRQGQDLILRASRGYAQPNGTRIPLEQGITGRVARSRRAELVRDVRSDADHLSGVPSGATEMAVPLVVFGELLGVLDAESPHAEAFTEEDLDLFTAFAEQAAVALHNAQLFWRLEDANRRLTLNIEEMQRLNRELEIYSGRMHEANRNLEVQLTQLQTLFEATRTITSSLDLRETLDAILAMTQRIVNSSAGAIKLLDEERGELRVKAQAGFDHEDSAAWDRLDLPLRIGDRTIGVFEVIRDASREMGEGEHRMLETLATHAAIAIENARLFDDTQRMYYDTLRALAKALEARDDYTRGHSERVAELALATAAALGLPEEDCEAIHHAALLHDIGKIGVRDAVLLKEIPLSESDVEVIRQHPGLGTTILEPLRFFGRGAEWVRHHHERWDGRGYPDHLAGEAIPLASRIICVADCYDAMTSTRPYRRPRTHDEAIAELHQYAGHQFDPQVVEAFTRMMAVGRG